MKLNNCIRFCIVLLVLNSCSNPEKKIYSQVETIAIPEGNEYNLLNESVIEDITIIPLETQDNCLVGNIDHVESFNNQYFIEDTRNKSLFVFDSEGKFIFKLHAVGQGPGEYIEIRDFKFDNDGNLLILDFNKILKYNSSNGKFISDFKFNYLNSKNLQLNPLQFIPLNDEGFYFWRGSFGVEDSNCNNMFALYKANKKGEIVDKYFKLERPMLGSINRFSRYSANCYYMQTFQGNDTIYSISEKGVIPTYAIDFGKRAVPNNYLPKGFKGLGKIYFDMRENLGYCHDIDNILESKDFLYFTFLCKGGRGEALYSKKSGSIKVGKYLFHSLPSAVGFRCFNRDKNEFISIMDDYSVSDIIEGKTENEKYYSLFDKQIMKAIENKSDISNPCLIVYKLKGF